MSVFPLTFTAGEYIGADKTNSCFLFDFFSTGNHRFCVREDRFSRCCHADMHYKELHHQKSDGGMNNRNRPKADTESLLGPYRIEIQHSAYDLYAQQQAYEKEIGHLLKRIQPTLARLFERMRMPFEYADEIVNGNSHDIRNARDILFPFPGHDMPEESENRQNNEYPSNAIMIHTGLFETDDMIGTMYLQNR